MADEAVHIARAGVEIGAFTLAVIRAKIGSGEFLPTDHYWKPGMAAWQRLANLPGTKRTLPFRRPVDKGANLFDQVMGRSGYLDGLRLLWDELAAAPTECLVAEATLLAINEKVRYDVRKRCRSDLAKWYLVAVEAYLSDRYFAPEEKTNLANLARTFGLDDAAAESLHAEAFASYCRIGMLTAFQRAVPPEQRRKEIDLLGKEVPLSEAKVREVFAQALQSYFDQRIKVLFTQEEGGEVMDPVAYDALVAEIKLMGVTMNIDAKSQEKLDSARRLYALCRQPLREVPCELELGSEGCYWTQSVGLGVNKNVTTRRSYGGFSSSIKIWGPLRYRVGSYDVDRQTEKRLVRVDEGTLVFTSKRVIFTGSVKSLNFRLTKILDITVYADALQIDKDSGGDVVFFFPSGQTEAAIILRRLMRQAKG